MRAIGPKRHVRFVALHSRAAQECFEVLRRETRHLVEKLNEGCMAFDERVYADTETHDILPHWACNSIVAPSRADARLQIRKKFDLFEHRRYTTSLEKEGPATSLQLGQSRLAELLKAEIITNAPKNCAGFEERLVWAALLGLLDIDSCMSAFR